MEWTKQIPTKSGWYWIYYGDNVLKGTEFYKRYVACVGIEITDNGFYVDTFADGYECDPEIYPEDITHFM